MKITIPQPLIFAFCILLSACASTPGDKPRQESFVQQPFFVSTEPGLTDLQKRWALATTGIVAEINSERHELLAGGELTPRSTNAYKKILSDWWGITNRSELIKTLQWIEQGGHRQKFNSLGEAVVKLSDEQYNDSLIKAQSDADIMQKLRIVRRYYNQLENKSLLGWDYCRFISLCRWGYIAGYINENEAWNCIMPAARRLQKTFSSWRDLGENYLIGREFWSYEQTTRSGQKCRAVYQKLITDSNSPWNRLLWETNLQSR